MIRDEDFSVDLDTREVRHVSGVVMAFNSYLDHETWLRSETVKMRNPRLFDGSEMELAAAAKRIAIAAGMQHKRPGK